jgi:tetratricopeptide (TPR) repeat protein
MSKKKRTSLKTLEGPIEPPTMRRGWILGLILGVTFLTFANTISNGFAYDDQTFILQNQLIQSSSLGEAVSKLPVVLTKELWFYRVMQDKDPNKDTGPTTPYYRPTFSIFHMICWQLFQANPAGWHFMNVLLHILAVYFVFLIVERISKDLKVSAIASLLFAIHPLRAESVAWICGVSDPFLAVFLLPSFYLYVRFRDEGRLAFLFTALVLFLFAAFTKEPAIALPLFIGAYELFILNREKPIRERIKPAIKYSACFLFVSSLYFLARYYALGFAVNNTNFKNYPVGGILLTIPIVIWKYLLLLIWPVDLSLFHATPIIKNPLNVEFIVPFLALIALVLALWRLRNSTVARFGILWFGINLLPVLNLSAFAEDFLVQERYVYIPSIGFSLLIAIAVARAPIEKWLPLGSRAVAQTALVGLLVLLLAAKSFAQNTTWRDDMTLWSHGVEAAAEQPMSHYILGHKLINLGDFEKAAGQLEEFLKLNPGNLIVMSNLASTNVIIYQNAAAQNPGAADRALLDRALELCEKGLAKQGDFPPLWDTLGTIYTFETGLKNYDRAIACFQRGLSFNSQNAMITFHLGGTLTKKGDLENGVRFLQAALQMEPKLTDAHKFLAYAYRGRGQLKEAVDSLSTYLKLQPNAPDASRVAKDLQDFRAQLQASSPQS